MAKKEDLTLLQNRNAYLEMFSDPSTAHLHALDIRKFEIELYWKRAAYFWALIAASLAGFLILAAKQDSPWELSFLGGCIGFTLSLAWALVNRGSKYWQQNWERHVDILEDCAVGSLYKATISPEEFSFWKFSRGYPYSVSRLNQVISVYITAIWFAILWWCGWNLGWNKFLSILPMASAALTALASIWLLSCSSSAGRVSRTINFRLSPLQDKAPENADKV